MEYTQAKFAARSAVAKFGKYLPGGLAPHHLTHEQRKHRAGENIMTDERAGSCLLRGGELLACVEFGRFLDSWLFAVNVYCLGELRASEHYGDGRALDFDLSRCLHSPAELEAALEELENAPDWAALAKIAEANRLGEYKRGKHGDAVALALNPYQRPAKVTAEEAEEMLGAVPPVYPEGARGFCVGEAITHSNDGRAAILANYYEEGGQWFARYHLAIGERV